MAAGRGPRTITFQQASAEAIRGIAHSSPLGLGAPYTTSVEEDVSTIRLPLFADELTGRIDFQGDRYDEHHMPLVDKLPDSRRAAAMPAADAPS
ncbi:hypothetical protein AB0926_33125 [Streptomyces griseoincarnatus]